MHADLLTKPAALAPQHQRALPLAALAAEHSPRTTCLLSLAGAAMCRRGAARRPLQLPHPCPAHAAPDQPPSLVAGERRTVRERADSDALDVSSPHVHHPAKPPAGPRKGCPSTSCTRSCCSSQCLGAFAVSPQRRCLRALTPRAAYRWVHLATAIPNVHQVYACAKKWGSQTAKISSSMETLVIAWNTGTPAIRLHTGTSLEYTIRTSSNFRHCVFRMVHRAAGMKNASFA